MSTRTFTFTVQAASGPTWFSSALDSEWTTVGTGGAAPTLSAVNPCPSGGCPYSAVEGQAGAVDDWCGGVASPASLIIAAQGGHQGYAGNEVYEFDFALDTPRWYRRVDPSTSVQSDVAYYADGKPSSRHGYNHDCYIGAGTNGDRWFSAFAAFVYGSGVSFAVPASWPKGSAAYDAQGMFPNFPGALAYEGYAAYDSATHKVWVCEGPAQADWTLWSLDVATKAWAQHGNSSGFPSNANVSAFVDPVRRVLVAQTGSSVYVHDLAFPNSAGRVYAVSGLPAASGPGWKLEPVSGKWVRWNGGKTLHVITPPANYRSGDGSTSNALNASASYSVGATLNPSGGATPTSPNTNGTFGRFNYVSDYRGFCVVNRVNESMYFYKVPVAGL